MAQASGFVYSVNVCGITGTREKLPAEITEHLTELKQNSPAPVAAGFGVTDGTMAHHLSQIADGIIVGSAFIKILSGEGDFAHRLETASKFIRELAQNVRRQP